MLTRAGIRFRIMEPPEDAALPVGVSAELAVQLVARQKAVAVSKLVPAGTYVLSADTIVVGPRGPLGKPKTPELAQFVGAVTG